MERLESRTLLSAAPDDGVGPTAALNAPAVTTAGVSSETFTVTYKDDTAVSSASLAGAVTVTAPNGAVLPIASATADTTDGPTVVETYTVNAPSGTFGQGDQGNYSVLSNGSASDTSGNVTPPQVLGSFNVKLPPPPDTTAPAATVSSADITSAGGKTHTVTVVYSDNVAIKADTIHSNGIIVTAPDGSALKVASVSVDSAQNGPTITATYKVNAPGGSWTSDDDGPYNIAVQPTVTDTAGNPVGAASGSFKVSIAAADTTPPTAALELGGDVTSAGGSRQVAVLYTDNVGVDPSTIGTGNISVNGPGGHIAVTGVGASGPGTSLTVTYTLEGGGPWSASDNGAYSVDVVGGQVKDAAGNAASPQIGFFHVNIPLPDTTPPSATVSAGDVTSPGATQTVTVVYTDNVAVRASSINKSGISVGGAAGNLGVQSVSVSPGGNGASLTAVYTLQTPSGGWVAADNGTYTVNVAGGSVTDTSGNGVSAASGAFNVALPTTPPSVSISAPAVTASGSAPEVVTVVYSDAFGVEASTIGAGNITVNGPNGALDVQSVTSTPASGAPGTLTATYTLAAPGGGWDSSDNGTYTVSLTGQVKDSIGNATSAGSGSFAVNVPPPPPGATDPKFASGSTVSTGFIVEGLLNEADGKILVVGRTGDPTAGQSQGVIERLNADGSLDSSFGSAGQVVTPAGANDEFFAAALQDSSHIVVAGTSGNDFLLARYDLTGNLDRTFGQSGRALTPIGGSAAAYGVAFEPDGSIVAAGGSAGNFAFAKYNSNGAVDPSFGQNGRELFNAGTATDVVGGVATESDGSIVAVGAAGTTVALVRLDSSGNANTSFGSGGLVVVPGLSVSSVAGALDHSEGLAVQPDGKLLVAKHTADGHFGIVRVNADGSIDSSFGAGGLASTSFGGNDDVDSVIVTASGEIYALGTTDSGGTPAIAIAAFDSSGAVDSTFGTGGRVTEAANLSPVSHELHVGDLVLKAFGGLSGGGKLLVGSSNEGTGSTLSSTLRRIIIPAVTAQPQETLLGTFGVVNKKNVKLPVTLTDGAVATFILSGGTGSAFQSPTGIHLVITDLGKGVSLTITTKHGSRVTLADVTVNGTLKSVTASTSDLAGTLFALNSIGKVTLGNVTGTIASGGNIGSVNLTSLAGANILAGANLGADGELGGTGGNADTYNAGSLASLVVSGAVTGSLIAAGLTPASGVASLANLANATVSGGKASSIKSISVRGGADAATRFVAGAVKSVKLPKKVVPATDSRFEIL